jgi:hypothetical protein
VGIFGGQGFGQAPTAGSPTPNLGMGGSLPFAGGGAVSGGGLGGLLQQLFSQFQPQPQQPQQPQLQAPQQTIGQVLGLGQGVQMPAPQPGTPFSEIGGGSGFDFGVAGRAPAQQQPQLTAPQAASPQAQSIFGNAFMQAAQRPGQGGPSPFAGPTGVTPIAQQAQIPQVPQILQNQAILQPFQGRAI